MTPSQIIQRIYEEADRREVHATAAQHREAVLREKAWKDLSADARRRILEFADGDFSLAVMAIDEARGVLV